MNSDVSVPESELAGSESFNACPSSPVFSSESQSQDLQASFTEAACKNQAAGNCKQHALPGPDPWDVCC